MNRTLSKWILRLLCAGLVLTLALSHAVLARGAGTGTIRIGDTMFAPEDAVSSGWTDGKGWKNLPGKYVALVDYQGQGKEVSRDGGELTLAVAGVNRIGKLAGDCSVNIVGTGIVLIDSIEIEEGNTISLLTDKAQYEEGSAAVFVKEGDDYVLINGSIPGILDEDYTLDGASLIVPKDSSLIFCAAGIRTETWYSENGPETEVTEYTTTIPFEATYPVHEGGEVTITGQAARLTLKSNSTLTVEKDASVVMEKVKKKTTLGTETIAPKLVIEGTLDIKGSVEGGIADVASGGALEGNGTLSSAEVNLPPGADLSSTLLLDGCSVTVTGNGQTRNVSAKINDCVIYLKGSGILLQNLTASGTSKIGVDTTQSIYGTCGIGNVTFPSGGGIEIYANDHDYYGTDWDAGPVRMIEDCYLEITGTITGGTVSVLAGCVKYSGTNTNNVPVAPAGYASRVLVEKNGITSTVDPLNMTQNEASRRAGLDEIPVMQCTVYYSLAGDGALMRSWDIMGATFLNELERDDDQIYTCRSFMELYDLHPEAYDVSMAETMYFPAVEIVNSDLVRERYWLTESIPFDVADAILIRVIYCVGRGGQGGSAITHTETTFTGSGVLGGTGDGDVTGGTGTVVYPRNYQPPTPTPTPTPTPAPTPMPTPTESGDDDETDGSGEQQNTQGTTAPATGAKTNGMLTTVVTVQGNGAYTVAAYSNGKELSGLNGTSVTVRVRDPEGIMENDVCYVAFENGGQSAWIPAEYDKEAKELVFETDQTGAFGIIRVVVEDMMYAETDKDKPAYRELSVWIGDKQITDLPGSVKVKAETTDDETGEANLYAVFVDENEKLRVFPAIYDDEHKCYWFESGVTGNFVMVKLDETMGSALELNDACRASEEVRTLITLMRLHAFWS